MYIGVEYKGVYKSIDKGQTWSKSSNGIDSYTKIGTNEPCIQEMGKLLIDPTNSNRLLLSRVESSGTITDLFSENAGVYLSTDAGANWKQLISGDMNASGSKAISFDSKNTQTLYYGTNNAPSSYGGADQTKFFNTVGVLYKSLDSGKTWKELNTGIDNYLRASDVLVDSSNSNKIFFATFRPSSVEGDMNLNSDQSKALLLSEDGGSTWKSIANRLPVASALIDMLQSKNNSKNMFLIGQSITQTEPSKTFNSTDGGNTFKLSAAISVYAAAFDPNNVSGNRMLVYMPFANTPGIHQSTDGGATFSFYSSLPTDTDGNKVKISNITWDSKDANTIYLNGDAGYLLRSTDNGFNDFLQTPC